MSCKGRYSYKEIAKQLGVTRQRVHQIKKICLKRLREEWKEIKKELKNGKFEGFDPDNS